MIQKLRKIGTKHAVMLEKAILDQIGASSGDKVQIILTEGSLIVTPVFPRAVKTEVAARR